MRAVIPADTPIPPPAKRFRWPAALLFAAAGLAVTALRLPQGELWVTPDSAGYLTLAIGFAERGDWSNPLLLFRLPGYPLLLAAVLAAGGEHAALALRVVQHGMIVACAGLTVLIAQRFGVGRRLAVAAGLTTLANPYLAGYADAVLTEAAYAFLLSAWTLLLVIHLQSGGLRSLAAASVLAAALALFKDAGLALLLIGVVCGGWTAMARFANGQPRRGGTGRRALAAGVAAIAPAAVLLAPLVVHNHRTFDHCGLNCNGGMLPYYRAACVDRLDAPGSESVERIRDMLARARREGVVAADATVHDYLSTVRAVQHAFDPTSRQTFVSRELPRIANLLGDAGWDIVREHPLPVAFDTARHARHLLLTPDGAGVDLRGRYTGFVVRRVGADAVQRYLPGIAGDAAAVAAGDAFNRALRRMMEAPLPVMGISLYALFVLAGLAGGAVALVRGPRGPAVVLGLVAAYHVGGAAFMGGLEPRYVVPVHPLFAVWAACLAGVVCRRFHARTQATASEAARVELSPGRS